MDDVALVVIGNGREAYLEQVIDAAFEHLPPLGAYLMVDDSGDRSTALNLARNYPDFHLHSNATNQGMAKAVQAGFDLVLTHTPCSYALWLEEDMLLTADVPIEDAVRELAQHPHLAQMLFQRQPITPAELDAGSVLAAMNPEGNHDLWAVQRHIFSLNPCLIPRPILELGWPAGNERQMTDELLEAGWSFGVWRDGPYVEHIGASRGSQWQL